MRLYKLKEKRVPLGHWCQTVNITENLESLLNLFMASTRNMHLGISHSGINRSVPSPYGVTVLLSPACDPESTLPPPWGGYSVLSTGTWVRVRV